MLGPAACLLGLSLLAAASAAAPAARADAARAVAAKPVKTTVVMGALVAAVPAGWVRETPKSAMRKAQFRLPKVAGDGEDAEAVVFYFGAQAGSVEANLDRWLSQMVQADGQPAKGQAQVTKREVHGMKATVLDVSGRYVAQAMPGMGDAIDRPGSRVIAAIVEAADGAYYLKVTGPARTVAAWEKGVSEFVDSFAPSAR